MLLVIVPLLESGSGKQKDLSDLGSTLTKTPVSFHTDKSQGTIHRHADIENLLTRRAVFISRLLYWSMMEVGLAVVVACLPTLQSLVRNAWPENLYRRVHTILSSRLLPSKRSRASYPDDTDDGSTSSNTSINKRQALKVKTEIYVLTSLNQQSHLKSSGISVQRALHLDSEIV